LSKRSKSLKIEKKETKLTRRERLLTWLGNRIGIKIQKTTPVQPTFVFEPQPQIRRPFYDYVNLFEVATTSWPLRRAFRAIIQECSREKPLRVPKFKWKCKKEDCGKEFKETPKDNKCDSCGSKLRVPSEEQAKEFDRLISRPNRDYSFRDLYRSALFYDLALDEQYLGVAYKYLPKSERDLKTGLMRTVISEGRVVYDKKPFEVYIEDARYFFPIADELGHLGGYEWFCPNCYDSEQFKKQDMPVVQIMPEMPSEQQERLKICEYCNGPMIQTYYVQEVSGVVLARFGPGEIVHGSSSGVKPRLFGNPKIVSIWKPIQTVAAMDNYNWEVYSKGKVGSIIGFPGDDDVEIAAKKTAIEEELQSLDQEDITTGRYRTSPAIRTLFIGLKKDQHPIRLPIMEDLKAMQSLEFYAKYINAIGEVYGVTAEFVSVSEPGGQHKLKIEVQDRTTQEHQTNFKELWNYGILPKFGITDWLLDFPPIRGRDKLRDAQTLHTKMATALQGARAGFDVVIDENEELKITGKAKLQEGEPFGSRFGEKPRDMGGKPEEFEEGEPTRTSGERLELAERTDLASPLPISWYSATQIRVWDKVFAINSDQNEVYITINEHEIEGTRTSATKLNLAISNLLEQLLGFVKTKLEGVGFNEDDYDAGVKRLLTNTRREFNPKLLIELANYFDSIKLEWLGQKIDNLRYRLSRIKFSPLESPAGSEPTEMPEPIERKSIIQARAPFGVVHDESTLYKKLIKIKDWAIKQVKDGKQKGIVVNEAMVKAKQTMEKSYSELTKRALKHAERRTRKKVGLSPEEIKRIEIYKQNSLDDFHKILYDSLRGVKKR